MEGTERILHEISVIVFQLKLVEIWYSCNLLRG